MKTLGFEKYVNLIRSRVHYFSTKYGFDYDELESQGFLIYCECLEKYDVGKSKFTTYLYIQLNRLKDYILTYRRQQGENLQDYLSNDVDVEGKDLVELLPSRELSPTMQDLLDDAKETLSENAYNILIWILNREWEEKQSKRTPTISMARRYFNLSKKIIDQAWDECKTFWNCRGFALYS